MSRREFIESWGATCKNWQWSWSFINERDRFVIFGLWSDNATDEGDMILGRGWELNQAGRHGPGYKESLQHIRLVTESGFDLYTFTKFAARDANGELIRNEGRVQIQSIDDTSLQQSFVYETEDGWHAAPAPTPPVKLHAPLISRIFEEGERARVVAQRVERSSGARMSCLEHYGYACQVCDFAMSDLYGPVGEGVIEVHHLHEMALCDRKRKVDAINDLVPVCPNCHAIIHRRRPAYSPDEVRLMLRVRPAD